MIVRRRVVINGMASLAVLAKFDSSRAQDPATAAAAITWLTVLQYGASILTILGTITTWVSQSNEARALSDINGKLDVITNKLNEVIEGQFAIILALAELRLAIDASILNGFQDSAFARLQGNSDRYRIILASRKRRLDMDEVDRLKGDILQTCGELGHYTPMAYIAFACGVSMSIVLQKLSHTSKEQIRQSIAIHTEKYDHWLAEPSENPTGIKASVLRTTGLIETAKKDLNTRPKRFLIDSYKSFDAPDISCSHNKYLNITGNIEDGYDYDVDDVRGECVELSQSWPDISNVRKSVEANIVAIEREELSTKALASVPSTGVVVPEPEELTPYSQYNDINAKRLQFFQLLELKAKQTLIQQQISDARVAIRKLRV